MEKTKMENKKRTLFVINGPNLNLLGQREPNVYGCDTLVHLDERIAKLGRSHGYDFVACFQSNFEGELVELIHKAGKSSADVVLNAGAYSHSSIALRDAILATKIRAIEVHISNVYARESFRQASMVAPVCIGVISGLGTIGYELAVAYLARSALSEAVSS